MVASLTIMIQRVAHYFVALRRRPKSAEPFIFTFLFVFSFERVFLLMSVDFMI